MVIFAFMVEKAWEKNGVLHGKPNHNLAGFMEYVEPTVCAPIILIMGENAHAFQVTRSPMQVTGLLGVSQNSICLAAHQSLGFYT